MKSRISKSYLWVSIIICIFFIHLLTLMRYPAPFIDEAWLVSRAWAFIQTGHQYGPLDYGIAEQYTGYWVLNQWLITALQSLVLRLFSHPELWPLRLLSFTEGIGLIAVSYWSAMRLSGKSVAICSSILLAVSHAFFYTAHLVRYDILASLLGYLALAIAINDRRDRFGLGMLAGLFLGLAVETHLNSLIFIPTLGIFYLIEHKGLFFRKANFWGFVFGTCLGIGLYLSLHILPYPDMYFKINAIQFGKTQIPPLLSLNLIRILEGFKDASLLLIFGSGWIFLLGIFALPILLYRKNRANMEILAINISLWMGSALLFPTRADHYSIYLTPAFLWLAAIYLIDFINKPWLRGVKGYVIQALVWGLVVSTLIFNAISLIPNGYQNYTQAQEKINKSIQPNDIIMGSQIYWLGLNGHRYYSWELLFLYPRFYPGKTLADALQYYHPDILIIDGNMSIFISDTINPSDWWFNYRVSHKELYDYLKIHAQQVLAADNLAYCGFVQVYRFKW